MIFDDFLKSRKPYMLFLLPFLMAGIGFLNYYLPETSDSGGQLHGIIYFDWLERLDLSNIFVAGCILTLVIAYLLFFINMAYKFLPQTTALPAFLYVLITLGIVYSPADIHLMLAVIVVGIAFASLQSAIQETQSNGAIFNFGFCICLAVLFSPKLVLLLIWAVCVLLFSGRSTLKDIVALLFGIITPLLFAAFAYFWTDRLPSVFPSFLDNLLSGEFLRKLSETDIIRVGVLAFLILISLYNIMVNYPVSVVNQRRGMLSLVSLLFFLVATIVVIPGITLSFMCMLALPLSYIYSQYFITQRSRIWGDLMFVLLLAGCAATYIDTLF